MGPDNRAHSLVEVDGIIVEDIDGVSGRDGLDQAIHGEGGEAARGAVGQRGDLGQLARRIEPGKSREEMRHMSGGVEVAMAACKS